MLLKHVKVTGNWGTIREVLRFQQLEHHLCNLRLRITHLEAECRGVLQAQSASKGRLELAHLEYFASDLRILTGLEESQGGRNNCRNDRHWCGMDPF
jgi:hypothetical protein